MCIYIYICFVLFYKFIAIKRIQRENEIVSKIRICSFALFLLLLQLQYHQAHKLRFGYPKSISVDITSTPS